MKQCFLDNASTTRIKPQSVYQAVIDTMQDIGCSPSRGGYDCALQAGRKIFHTRLLLAKLFNVADSRHIVFTPGITWSINMAISGLLSVGDHVITTSIEHNALSRPLRILERDRGVQVSWVQCNKFGQVNLKDIEDSINENTKLIAVNHASNIVGTILPLAKITAIAKKYNIMVLADCAQTAGYCDLDFEKLNLDILAFTGHKALFGPPGVGGMVLSERAAREINPVIAGGTGSNSENIFQPDNLPDKFECGTQNTPAIAGLGAGVQFILDTGLDNIRKHESELLQQLVDGFQSIPQVTVYTSGNIENQVPTISITVDHMDIGNVSLLLDERYGIMTRSGIHCSPLCHRTIGTYPNGAIRFSIGYFNTVDDIEYALKAVKEIVREGSGSHE